MQLLPPEKSGLEPQAGSNKGLLLGNISTWRQSGFGSPRILGPPRIGGGCGGINVKTSVIRCRNSELRSNDEEDTPFRLNQIHDGHMINTIMWSPLNSKLILNLYLFYL
ncbi:hypothetical protein TNCV_998631 [Trichonephila clavipes]|nr:hypothetical protein TNCV_998631 [Trichonephila clavipes]